MYIFLTTTVLLCRIYVYSECRPASFIFFCLLLFLHRLLIRLISCDMRACREFFLFVCIVRKMNT